MLSIGYFLFSIIESSFSLLFCDSWGLEFDNRGDYTVVKTDYNRDETSSIIDPIVLSHEMSSKELSRWIMQLQYRNVSIGRDRLQKYAEIFLAEDLDGKCLYCLNEDALHKLGISYGHSFQIANEMKQEDILRGKNAVE